MVGSIKDDQLNAELPLSQGRRHLEVVRVHVAKLREAFGDDFLAFMCVTYFGLKGVASMFVQTAQLPLFKSFGVSADLYQLASMVTMTPWAMKGWLGVLSDCLPLGGYHKRGYLVASAVLGIIGGIFLLSMLLYGTGKGLWTATSCIFCVMMCIATFDLLCEGKYTEVMRRRGSGSGAVSFVWANVNLGGLLASITTMYTVDAYGPGLLVGMSLPFIVLVTAMAMRGFLPEERARSRGFQWAKMRSEPGLFSLASCMGLGALVVNVAAAVLSSRWHITLAVCVSVGLCVLSFRTLPRTLAKSNLYLFLQSVSYLSIDGPLSYFYTGNEQCVPGGPNFSYGYYLAISSLFGGVFGTIGTLLFQCIESWSFRSAFKITTLVTSIAAIFDLIIVQRWNLLIHISDKAMFLFGDAACQQIAQMLVFMPGVLMNSLLCPRGAEATVYAILAGFQNFGAQIAQALGVWLVRELGIKAGEGGNAGECDFSNLGTAIVIGHMVIPILILPLTNCLIPDVKMNDENAFSAVSPPPSFCSPSSPRNSLDSPPDSSEKMDSTGLQDPLLSGSTDVVLTGFSRQNSR
mmetsp:Transcript_94667/g.181849  ORF Transcript_94667/g.181849 Transcript_94667/m.181849 type:complete len:575 (-) Transcript_94667:2-1726(-)